MNEHPYLQLPTAYQSATSSLAPLTDYSLRTVVPFDCFKAVQDANDLKKALDSSDKDILIDVLCHRSQSQRLEIASTFLRIYGISLPRHIKDEISIIKSDFSFLICGLTMPLYEFLARAVHNSDSYRWMCFIIIVISHNDRALMTNYYNTSK